jgi:hypothetical protein
MTIRTFAPDEVPAVQRYGLGLREPSRPALGRSSGRMYLRCTRRAPARIATYLGVRMALACRPASRSISTRTAGGTEERITRSSLEFRFCSVGVFVVRKSNWTPSIVPRGDDHDVYLVVDDLGRLGWVWREAEFETTDYETVILDLLEGQYKNPTGIFCFNTFEGWSRDVSEDVAKELRRRCDLQLRDVPSSIQDFVERHEGKDRDIQLPVQMRLV